MVDRSQTIRHDHDNNAYLATLTDDAAPRPVADGDVVVCANTRWRLSLPTVQPRTWRPGSVSIAVSECALHFWINPAEEISRVQVRARGRVIDLEVKAHLYVLLLLARARAEDARSGLRPIREHGWLYRPKLAAMLAPRSKNRINLLTVSISRIRRQFRDSGVRGDIIEKTGRDTRTVRIGIADIHFHT